MAITLEEEKRLVLLLIEDLGGSGTRRPVLDNIQKQNYLEFTNHACSRPAFGGGDAGRFSQSWAILNNVFKLEETADG